MRQLFRILSALTIVIALTASFFQYKRAENVMGNIAMERANSIASLLDDELFSEQLSGTEADLENEAYNQLKEKLTNLHDIYSNSRFVYVMGKSSENETIFFYADSEPSTSEDYSPPGDIYSDKREDDPAAYDLFEGSTKQVAYIDQDKWGTWLTGLAPIVQEGKVVALVGIDVGVEDEYLPFIVNQTLIPCLIGLIILLLLTILSQIERKKANQLEIKEKTLSLAIHEVRNPMTGILLGIESLLDQLADKSPKKAMHRDLIEVHKEAERILNYFNNLLTSSILERQKNINKEKFCLQELIASSILHLDLLVKEKDLQILQKGPKSKVLLLSNKDWIKLVIDNLLSNAVKYSFEGTKILVELEKDAAFAVIRIHNKGAGIAPEELDKIFQEYYRGGNVMGKVTGSGMGLSTTRKILQRLGGSIKVESAKEETTFTVHLPLKEQRS